MAKKLIKQWSIVLLFWFVLLQHFDAAIIDEPLKLSFYTALSLSVGHLLIAVFVAALNRWHPFIFRLWVAIPILDIINIILGNFITKYTDHLQLLATISALLTFTLVHYGKRHFIVVYDAAVSWFRRYATS